MKHATGIPSKIRISSLTHARERFYRATVVDESGYEMAYREFLNPQNCDDWARSWALPIEGSTW